MNPKLRRPLRITLNPDDVLFFQHIPKTGGLSLIEFLDSQFPPEAIFPLHSLGSAAEITKFTPDQLREFRLIRGHFGFGPYDNAIYRYITQNPILITFLREPVARTISAHRYRQRVQEIGQDVTLEQYLTDPLYAKNVINRQTRIIAGKIEPLEQEGSDKPPLPDSVILQVAKENIEFMAFVGLTEKFKESMQLLCHTFDWRMPQDIPQINSSPEPFDPSSLPPSTLELLKEKTQLDAELYEFATQLFQERYQQMVDNLVEENYDLRNPNAKEAALEDTSPSLWSHKVIRSVRRRLFPDGTHREAIYSQMRDSIFKRPQSGAVRAENPKH